MIGLLLGAGFSKWAAGLPVAAELFDFNLTPHNEKDARRLDRIVALKSEWDTANPMCPAEQFISDMVGSSDREKTLVTWYVGRRLSDPFVGRMLGGTQALMIDDRRKSQVDGVRMAQQFLSTLPLEQLSGVVTTNYDLLVEYALGTSGFNYGEVGETLTGRGKNPWFPWQGTGVRLTGSLRLAKIHGSLSWDEEHHYTDGRCGVKGSALIVPPTPDKKPPPQIDSVWKLAEKVIETAHQLLVFGFGFNQYDQAVLSFLRRAGQRLESVLLVDPHPNEKFAAQLWPKASITSQAPSEGHPPELKAWVAHA